MILQKANSYIRKRGGLLGGAEPGIQGGFRMTALLAVIVMAIALFGMAGTADAALHAYYFDADTAGPTTIATGVATDMTTCGTFTGPPSVGIALRDTVGTCADREQQAANIGPVFEYWYPTAVAATTNITGQATGNLWYLRERVNQGPNNVTLSILKVTSTGTITVLGGATYALASGENADIDFDLSAVSGTLNVGEKLGFRLSFDSGTSTQMRAYFGPGNGAGGGNVGYVTVDEAIPAGPTLSTGPTASATDSGTHVDGTFTLTSTWASTPGVSACNYTIDGTTWVGGTVTGTGPYTCTATPTCTEADNPMTLNMQATDSGGTTTATSISRTCDTVAPTTSDNASATWVNTSPQAVTLTPVDTTGGNSGVGSTNWCVDTATPGTCDPAGNTGTSASVTCTAGNACTRYVRYRSTDNVGNIETTKTSTNVINIDMANPGEVTGFAGVAGNNTVALSWNANASDTGSGLDTTNTYKVVRGTTLPADYCGAGTVVYTGNGTSHPENTAANGTTYYYKLCTLDNAGNYSAGSPVGPVTPQACAAIAPGDLTAPTVNSDNVIVQWTGASCGASNNDTYRVYRNGVLVTGSEQACSAGTMTYDDTSVSAETTYNTPGYTVRGYNTSGTCESSDSNAVAVTTPASEYLLGGCSSCHNYTSLDDEGNIRNALTGNFVGSHDTHLNLGMICTYCHADNSANNHRNAYISMANNGTSYGKGASFPQTNTPTPYQTCSNLNCHGTASPTWADNSGTKGDCSICHGMSDSPATYRDTAGQTGNTDAEVGAHLNHLTSGHNYTNDITCANCHTQPTGSTYTQKVLEGTNHNDGIGNAINAEITWSTFATNSGNLDPAYTGAQCNNTYCHGATLSDGDKPPTWATPGLTGVKTTDCAYCHGYPPSTITDHDGLNVNTADECAGCHSHVSTNNDGFTDITKHMNGIIEGGSCYGCHSQVKGTRRAVMTEFVNGTSGHMMYNVSVALEAALVTDCGKCHTENGTLHKDGALDNNRATGIISPPNTAFCVDCHKSGATNNDFTGDVAGAAMDINTAYTTGTDRFNHSAEAGCTDCHGDGSGNVRIHNSATAGLLKYSTQNNTCFQTSPVNACHATGSTAVNKIQDEFNPTNATGGTHPVLGTVTPKSTVLQADTTGAMFVDGWSKDSVATCTDCHSMNGTGPRGPHGSSYDYILKGLDTSIDGTGGTGPTSGRAYGTPKNSSVTGWGDATYAQENLCLNCHASDVYGLSAFDNGTNPTTAITPSQMGLSPMGHNDFAESVMRLDCLFPFGLTDAADGGATEIWAGANPEGSFQKNGCTNCHAGAGAGESNGTMSFGAHGSNYATASYTTGGGFPSNSNNTGLMDGNSWLQAPDDTNACYAESALNSGTPANPSWNSCAKGFHN